MAKGGIKPQAACHPNMPHFSKGMCKACYKAEYGKSYYEKNRIDLLAKQKKRVSRDRPHLMERYGLTPEDYDAMLRAQDGKCAICGREDSGRSDKRSLCVDHDHDTGAVRGLLCDPCNNGLGRFNDDPSLLMAAIRYLQNQRVRQSNVG